MSPLSPKQALMNRKTRRGVIRENILTHTYQQLANLCGVSKRTIIRDVDRWRDEGGFEEFLMDEFLRFYPDIKHEYPERAFDRLCYLLGKTFVQKVKAETTVKGEVKHRTDINILLQKYEAIVERATDRNLQENNTRKPVHTAHADS